MPQLRPATGSLIFLSTVLLLLVLVISTKEIKPPMPTSMEGSGSKETSVRVIS